MKLIALQIFALLALNAPIFAQAEVPEKQSASLTNVGPKVKAMERIFINASKNRDGVTAEIPESAS